MVAALAHPLPVSFRRPTRDDLPFVLSAWKRGARDLEEFGAVEGGQTPEQHFGRWFGARIERALRVQTTQVQLACDSEDARTLHGFVAVNTKRRGVLWWYVKQSFRKMGLGRMLLVEAGLIAAEMFRGVDVPSEPLRFAYTKVSLQNRLPRYAASVVYDPSCWEP